MMTKEEIEKATSEARRFIADDARENTPSGTWYTASAMQSAFVSGFRAAIKYSRATTKSD